MLYEIPNVRQVEGDPRRRWFQDAYFDLIVWYAEDDSIIGFQLCYEVMADEHVLTWHRDRGYAHNRIDSGEDVPARNMTPILVPDGVFERDRVSERFRRSCEQIDEVVATLVQVKLAEYEEHPT